MYRDKICTYMQDRVRLAKSKIEDEELRTKRNIISEKNLRVK